MKRILLFILLSCAVSIQTWAQTKSIFKLTVLDSHDPNRTDEWSDFYLTVFPGSIPSQSLFPFFGDKPLSLYSVLISFYGQICDTSPIDKNGHLDWNQMKLLEFDKKDVVYTPNEKYMPLNAAFMNSSIILRRENHESFNVNIPSSILNHIIHTYPKLNLIYMRIIVGQNGRMHDAYFILNRQCVPINCIPREIETQKGEGERLSNLPDGLHMHIIQGRVGTLSSPESFSSEYFLFDPQPPYVYPYDISITFFREKDLSHPVIETTLNIPWDKMQRMTFTPKDVVYTPDERYMPADVSFEDSKILIHRNDPSPFMVHIPWSILSSFPPPKEMLPEEVDYGIDNTVWNYLRVQATYKGKTSETKPRDGGKEDYVNTRAFAIPQIYLNSSPAKKVEIVDLGEDDIGSLFEDSIKVPQPKNCIHDYVDIQYPEILKFIREDTIKTQNSSKPLPKNHDHIPYLQHTPTFTIIEENSSYTSNNDDFTEDFDFIIHKDTTHFVYSPDDEFVSKQPATEGLWAAIYNDVEEMQRGYKPGDKTYLKGLALEEIDELINKMNTYAEKKGLPWLFTPTFGNPSDTLAVKLGQNIINPDSCFYICANRISSGKHVGKSTKYWTIHYSDIKECKYPGCTYINTYHKTYRHKTDFWAHILKSWLENCCKGYNNGTLANLDKLKKGLTIEPRTEIHSYIVWAVKIITTGQKCRKCHKVFKMDNPRYEIEYYPSKIEAETRVNSIKQRLN